jgi:uncharacterized protein
MYMARSTSHAKLIQATQKFVQNALSGEGTGHDWWHIERVRATARALHKAEGGSWPIIELAVLLHDVGDRKVIHQEADDYTIAEEFLKSHGVSDAIIAEVLDIIMHMSFSASLATKRKGASIEFKIVQDADRLDALGAIGIARVFAFGGSRHRPLYDPTQKAQRVTNKKAYHALTSSSFHHFSEKILLLHKCMNTGTAKQIARHRHVYVKTFMREFLMEWRGLR